jgi:lipopolysaccharide transport system permease protein
MVPVQVPKRTHNRRRTVIRAEYSSWPAILASLSKLLQYRDLIYTLSVHRIKVRYKQSLLGVSWAILQPVSMMLIFTFIFSFIARVPTGGTPYPVFAFAALLPWSFFSTALTSASNGLVSHANLITKVYFPREILPLTYVIAALFDFLIASLALGGLMVYYGVTPTANAIYAIPIILVLAVFATAMAIFFSAVQVRFRDIGFAVPLLLQLWMFATPVVYPLSAVPDRLRVFYVLNPMVGVIENFRNVVLRGTALDYRALGISTSISLVLLVASYAYFKRVEATMADII